MQGSPKKQGFTSRLASKSGDMTKETQSSFTDDVWDVEQAGTVQNFIVGHEIV